jgi:hypothetical protein
MGHQETDLTLLSPEERSFRELMNRGDDFFKIEIFRSAKAWYSRALALNIHQEQARERIEECERLLSYERKVFAILGIAGSIVIITVLLLF